MNKEEIVKIIENSKILEKLSDDRIFCFNEFMSDNTIEDAFDEENNLIIQENCDYNFCSHLSKKEVEELGKVFLEISKFMGDSNE